MTEITNFSSQPLKVVFLPAGLPLCIAVFPNSNMAHSILDTFVEFQIFSAALLTLKLKNEEEKQWDRAQIWVPRCYVDGGRQDSGPEWGLEDPKTLSEAKGDPRTSLPKICPCAPPTGNLDITSWKASGEPTHHYPASHIDEKSYCRPQMILT